MTGAGQLVGQTGQAAELASAGELAGVLDSGAAVVAGVAAAAGVDEVCSQYMDFIDCVEKKVPQERQQPGS